VTTTTSGITAVNLVIVPSADQERSVEFYVGTLGFEKRTDVPFGDGYRWIEVYAPSGTTGIALAPPGPESTIGVQTGISLGTEDIDATHSHLRKMGADVDEEVSRMGDPVPPLFWFRDPDGNTLMVAQPMS
jgi:predicted enzyme related to lactoylglutathione lyase